MGKSDSVSIVDDLFDRYRRATATRLHLARVATDSKARLHLAAYGRALLGKTKPYLLCGLVWEQGKVEVGAAYTDKGVCKKCLQRLDRLARAIANGQPRDLWALARGKSFTLTTAEVKAALELPNIWGEFDGEAPQPTLLPEEFLPKGSGELIKREW